ncbi:MAG: HigA family addiction module antidote protein [Planctomycetes bacterium]|nr:HigA family addiction module antidote protein [Planctomycetota bacterium]
MEEIGTFQAEVARAIGVSPMRVSHVIRGTRPVTAEWALLFGRAFAESPEYWLNLQAANDLNAATRAHRRRILAIHPRVHAWFRPTNNRLKRSGRRSAAAEPEAGAFDRKKR